MNETKKESLNINQMSKKVHYTILKRFKNREKLFFDYYSSMVSEAKHKATKGEGLKILTPKQMLQRLQIALPQVRAGNNSENLLNEIRKIVFCLYQSKEVTKKVYNNITNQYKYKWILYS